MASISQAMYLLKAYCIQPLFLELLSDFFTIDSAAAANNQFSGLIHFRILHDLEIVYGLRTSQETIDAVTEVGKQMGKRPILAKDKPGFIVNRMLLPMLNEAVQVLDEDIGTVEDVDEGMLRGCNHPMGPLALADMIGLDILLEVMETFYLDLGDTKYRPAHLLRKMVSAGTWAASPALASISIRRARRWASTPFWLTAEFPGFPFFDFGPEGTPSGPFLQKTPPEQCSGGVLVLRQARLEVLVSKLLHGPVLPLLGAPQHGGQRHAVEGIGLDHGVQGHILKDQHVPSSRGWSKE